MKKYILSIIFTLSINTSLIAYCCEILEKNRTIKADNFHEFSTSFINNPFSQIIFSNDYIIISYIDIYSSFIPKKIINFVDKNEVHYPITPNYKIINKYDQKIKIKKNDEKNACIIRSKDDTGMLVRYHFYKIKFWILYMIEDNSI